MFYREENQHPELIKRALDSSVPLGNILIILLSIIRTKEVMKTMNIMFEIRIENI